MAAKYYKPFEFFVENSKHC